MDIHERLQVFFQKLADAPPAASAEEALALVCQTIEAVEDEFCSVPRETPAPLHFTGRMYAPQADHIRIQPCGALVADTRGHRVYCQPDGALSIVALPKRRTVFEKPGART
jgi:hypothetical protein